MSETATATPITEAATPGASGVRVTDADVSPVQGESVQERSEAIKRALGIQPEAAEESSDASDVETADTEPPKTEAAEPSAAQKAAEDRKERLASLRDKERALAAKRAEKRPRQIAPVAAAPAPQAAPAATLSEGQIAVDISEIASPAGLMRIAQRMKVDPVKFGASIREFLSDPEAQQTAETKRIVDPVLQEARDMIAALQAERDSFRAERTNSQKQAEGAQAASTFVAFATSNAEQAPLAASYMKHRGADALLDLADQACSGLPQGAGPQAILDAVEDALYELSTSLGIKPSSPPRNAKTAISQKPTAQGISNRAASERTEIVDEDARWSRMSVEERAAELKRRYA